MISSTSTVAPGALWTAHELSLQLDLRGKAHSGAIENMTRSELNNSAWALKHFNGQVRRIEVDWVFDGVHLSDLPSHNRILPFTTWKPLAPLRPLAV